MSSWESGTDRATRFARDDAVEGGIAELQLINITEDSL